MWVNSKQAAEILGVNNKSVEKAAFRATKSCKKFCTIKCHLCHFTYTDGIGRGGKILQIWIDDDLINSKNSEISPAGAFALTDSKNVKAAASGITESARRSNFTQGEDDGRGLCHRANHRGDQAQGGKLDGLRQGVCDAFGGREKEQKANANMRTNNRLVARDRKDNKGVIDANNAMDAGGSIDTCGRDARVFGLSLASSGARRDQEQTQIKQNERINDGYEHRDIGADVYDTCAGSETNRSPLPLWQINEQGEASAYIKAHAGDGLHQCEGNPVYQLRFQARSQECPGYDCGAVKGVGDEDNHSSEKRQSQDEAQNERGRAPMRERIYADKRLCASDGGSLVHGPETHYQHNTPLPQIYETRGESETQKAGDRGSYAELNLSGAGETNLPAIATCSDKKRKAAFEKYDVIKAWEDAKGKISEAAFLEYINARKICCVKVTANKLYDWQRKYKRGGLDALVDERDNNKTLKLEELGLAQLCIELILACKGMGKVDITNIYRSLNYHAVKNSLINFEDFQGKKDEVVSYEIVNRFVNNYLNKNKLVKNIILYGEDGAVGRGLPALGISNYAVSTINEVVEIDGSPLDLICNASELCDLIGWQNVSAIFKDKDEFESYVKEWQKRYTIIALIDTYSGVATFHISETENSLAIARAVAKYIVRYGRPKVIKGDNGKAFKSEYMREVLGALEIEYKAVRAYSGWLKPYVERNFRALQHSFSANLAGFIGHNISQRQAIEFFRSKKERRLKRGYKTNLTMLKNLNEVQELMDMYAEKFLNTRYLERLGTTCAAAYSAKVGDAMYMDAISISARLSKRELKHVHKKGVSIDNVWYYNLAMFAHERVFVNQNVNNINECFVWSENNEFIGVASTLDLELGVSAEEARTTQKLFNKRLKETKKQMDEALTAHQVSFEQTVRLAEAKPAALPKPQAVNNEAAIIDAALKEAKNLNSNAPLEGEILSAAGSDVSPKRAKKIKGWMEIGCARA